MDEQDWRASLRVGTKWFLASRIFLAVVVALATAIPRDVPAARLDSPILQALQIWDAGWLVGVSWNGYSFDAAHPRAYNVAFFPLFPMLMRGVGLAFGVSIPVLVWGGIVISNLLFWVSLVLLHRLLSADFSSVVADRSCCLLAFFPASIVCSTPYTESLFLVCVISALLAMRRDDALACGVWSAFAGATRSVGIILLLAIAVRAWQARRTADARRWVGAALLAPLGLLSYCAWLGWRFGDPAAFLRAQEWGWGRHSLPSSVASFVHAFPLAMREAWKGTPETLALPYVFFALFTIALGGVYHLRCPVRHALVAFTAGGLLLYLCTAVGVFISGTRYLMVLIPVYPVLATWSVERPLLGRVLLFAFVADCAVVGALFTRGYFVL